MDLRDVIAVAAMGLAGCSATATNGVSEARSAEIAKEQSFEAFVETCSMEATAAEPPPGAPPPPLTARPDAAEFAPGVFLDAAVFLLPGTKATTKVSTARSLMRDPDVQLLGTPHLTAVFDVTSRIAVVDASGPLAEPALREIAVTPRKSDDSQLVLELEATLTLPTTRAEALEPQKSKLHFIAAPRFGQAVALTAVLPERPKQSVLLLLTPYSLRSEADLRAIFQCKMVQRQRALASRH